MNLNKFRRETRAGHFISSVISSSVLHNNQSDFYCELLTCGITPRKIRKQNKTQLTASAFNSHYTTLLANLTSFMLFLSSQYWMKTHGGARTGLHLMVVFWFAQRLRSAYYAQDNRLALGRCHWVPILLSKSSSNSTGQLKMQRGRQIQEYT